MMFPSGLYVAKIIDNSCEAIQASFPNSEGYQTECVKVYLTFVPLVRIPESPHDPVIQCEVATRMMEDTITQSSIFQMMQRLELIECPGGRPFERSVDACERWSFRNHRILLTCNLMELPGCEPRELWQLAHACDPELCKIGRRYLLDTVMRRAEEVMTSERHPVIHAR